MPLKKSKTLTEKESVNGDRKKRVFNKLSILRKQKEAKENVSREQEESRSAKNWMRLFLSGSMRDGQMSFCVTKTHYEESCSNK